jgi:tRNA (cytidine/uridine-2'-O-)-methyltransferase
VAVRLALFQPDIPQNTGTILRMAACMGVAVDIIEPAGFPVSDRAFRRAGMDYLDQVAIVRHVSWTAFDAGRRAAGRRLVLATTAGSVPYTDPPFAAGDTILFGRESAGAPPEVHDAADARIRIPLLPGLRSLNIAVAAAMILGEALRRTGTFPAA